MIEILLLYFFLTGVVYVLLAFTVVENCQFDALYFLGLGVTSSLAALCLAMIRISTL